MALTPAHYIAAGLAITATRTKIDRVNALYTACESKRRVPSGHSGLAKSVPLRERHEKNAYQRNST